MRFEQRPDLGLAGVEFHDLAGFGVGKRDEADVKERLLAGIGDGDGDQVVPAIGHGHGMAGRRGEKIAYQKHHCQRFCTRLRYVQCRRQIQFARDGPGGDQMADEL